MNIFNSASAIRSHLAPSLPKGYVRRLVLNVAGFFTATTPVNGKMFNPEKYLDRHLIRGDIVRPLHEMPTSTLRTNFFA